MGMLPTQRLINTIHYPIFCKKNKKNKKGKEKNDYKENFLIYENSRNLSLNGHSSFLTQKVVGLSERLIYRGFWPKLCWQREHISNIFSAQVGYD